VLFSYFFFFSSRRRHTRSKRDWSSVVCSSDLILFVRGGGKGFFQRVCRGEHEGMQQRDEREEDIADVFGERMLRQRIIRERGARSAECRVGKEWRCGRAKWR